MCVAEFNELMQTGVFKIGPNSLEGKWFAERGDHALAWGKLLFPAKDFCVIEAGFRREQAERFMRLPRLDDIGPARYVELEMLNACKPKIEQWTP
jgi:hypothetical protein